MLLKNQTQADSVVCRCFLFPVSIYRFFSTIELFFSILELIDQYFYIVIEIVISALHNIWPQTSISFK